MSGEWWPGRVRPAFAPRKWKAGVVTRGGAACSRARTRSGNEASESRLGDERADLTSPAGRGGCRRTGPGGGAAEPLRVRLRPGTRRTSGRGAPARARDWGPEGGRRPGTGVRGPGTATFPAPEGQPPRQEGKAAEESLLLEIGTRRRPRAILSSASH